MGSYIGGSVAAGDGGLKGGNYNPFGGDKGSWKGTNWWKGAIVGGIVGAGAGALAATAFGGTAAMSLMSNGAGGSSLGWSITSSSLTTANIQMGFAGLSSGGDLDAMWKAGVTGLVSGAITGGLSNGLNPRFHNLGFFEGAGIHGITGGSASLVDGYLNDKRGKELLWYTLKGAGTSAILGGIQEGLSASLLDNGSFWTGGQKRIMLDGKWTGGYVLRENTIINRPDIPKFFSRLQKLFDQNPDLRLPASPRPKFYF